MKRREMLKTIGLLPVLAIATEIKPSQPEYVTQVLYKNGQRHSMLRTIDLGKSGLTETQLRHLSDMADTLKPCHIREPHLCR